MTMEHSGPGFALDVTHDTLREEAPTALTSSFDAT